MTASRMARFDRFFEDAGACARAEGGSNRTKCLKAYIRSSVQFRQASQAGSKRLILHCSRPSALAWILQAQRNNASCWSKGGSR